MTKTSGAGIFEQPRFEPRDRVDVEMVGRLVEDEDVRLGDERARQQHAPAPAAGQRVDGHVARQAEAIEHHLDALLHPPAVPFVELVLQPAEALEGRGRGVVRDVVRRVVIGGDHLAQRAEALGDDVEHRLRGRERHVLLEARDDHPGLAPDGAGIRRDGAGDDLEQRRLAGAVAADDRDPLPGVDLEGDAIEERQVTEGDGDGIQGEEGHRRRGGNACIVTGRRGAGRCSEASSEGPWMFTDGLTLGSGTPTADGQKMAVFRRSQAVCVAVRGTPLAAAHGDMRSTADRLPLWSRALIVVALAARRSPRLPSPLPPPRPANAGCSRSSGWTRSA